MYFYFLFLFMACGAVIGSFTNCFIWRLFKDESLMGRSYCPECRKQIHWYDNVPVLSFILLRGHCRHCRKNIIWQYPIVEISTSLLFAAVFYFAAKSMALSSSIDSLFWAMSDPHFVLRLVRDLFIVFIFTVVFIYDLRWYLVPDKAVLPAVIILLVINIFLGFIWWKILLAALVGAVFFLIQFVISKGKWIGGGDIRLGLLIGAAFGRLDFLALILMMSYFIGSVVGITLISLKKKGWKSEVPLGVFLAMASLISLFFGDNIINWYLGLI
jgi:prepilin signal peptidase PulO-like enzyme (type II secretory pathway)